ncbi:MAG: ribosome biogenesis GTP-binding protein YihA/YsxC [Simkaniaceae bacterium]|nr:ribosome biogenesis GTP-binding protein YihA/YsxC [Simkaniaceae bacterium]
MKFENATYLASAYTLEQFPKLQLPEIALCGRSNVGKSSLINHLLRNKNLAKVSSKPGKTQSINFFDIDRTITLVDLPGYGFAKRPHKVRTDWAVLIDDYLNNRPQLQMLLVLLDLRRQELSLQDEMLIKWGKSRDMEMLFIFTKSDALRAAQATKSINALAEHVKERCGLEEINYIPYSINTPTGRIALIKTLTERMPRER